MPACKAAGCHSGDDEFLACRVPDDERKAMPLILEGIVTTLNADHTVNVSPMGPIVERDFQRFTLRPYQTSTTYRNLKRSGCAVFHVVDDVELLAKAAVGDVDPVPPLIPCSSIPGQILADACRWYALRVEKLDDQDPRTTIVANVVEQGRGRDFFGFNRAKHAVLEAAILATRVQFLPADEIHAAWERLEVIVQKTAGEQEQRAFEFLTNFIAQAEATQQEHNA